MNATTISLLASALEGRYRVERELGAGGMATVYHACDLKHDRDVAIKVLHPDLGAALGGERFLAEIRTTARLQHPHILPLLDSGEASGLLYYVMPLVTGETLRERLAREQQLPIDDALRIAREVADALHYAHTNGIVHRDIKPENILLQGGHALVADFGIALAVQSAGGQRITQTGLSLGTPQYMSPEQALGERTISARSDIYSLGAVTYEMLTGEAPFTGPTVQAIVARLMSEPPRAITTQRRLVPRHVEAAVLKALEKVPADRFDSAAEFAAALHASGDAPALTRGSPRIARGSRSVAALGVIALATTVLAVAGWWKATHHVSSPVAFKLDFPEGHRYRPGSSLAVAPDGQSVVYVAVDKNGMPQLYLRTLASLEARPIPGADRASNPSFSADGKSIVFQRGLNVARIPVEGGEPTTLIANPGLTAVVAGPRQEVIYAGRNALWKVTTGSPPQVLVTPDASRNEVGIDNPMMLPDGKSIAFILVRRDSIGGLRSLVATMSIDGGQPAIIAGVQARRVIGFHDGFLLYVDPNNNLMAMQVDLRAHQASGDAVTLIAGRGQGGPELVASLSREGTLAYSFGSEMGQLVVMDDKGATTFASEQLRAFSLPSFSPDGKRVAVGLGGGGAAGIGGGSGVGDGNDIWVYDLGARVLTRVTTNGTSTRPKWSPDGRRVAYVRATGRRSEIWWTAADASGKEEQLAALPGDVGRTPEVTFMPDGRTVVVRAGTSMASNNEVQWQLYRVAIDGTRRMSPLFASGSIAPMTPSVSPNGKWLASLGRNGVNLGSVFVRPLSGEERVVQISAGSGVEPRWSADGRRLFYRADGAFRAATLTERNDSLIVVSRDSLFPDPDPPITTGAHQYDVHPDGKHFVMVRRTGSADVYMVTNWLQQVRERMLRSAQR